MLDYFCIFTKGGVLLWAMSFTALKGDPVNALIRTCLLEDRTGETFFPYNTPSGGAYTLKWSLNNGLGLVFVAVYQKALKLLYVDDLLDRVSRAFSPKYTVDSYTYSEFDAPFQKMLRDCEAKSEASRRQTGGSTAAAGASNGQSSKMQETNKSSVSAASSDDDEEDEDENNAASDTAGDNDVSEQQPQQSDASGAFNASLLIKKLGKRAVPGAKMGKKAEGPKSKDTSAPAGGNKKPTGKQARNWSDLVPGGAHKETGPLDFTEGERPASSMIASEDFTQPSLVDVEDDIVYDDEEEDIDAADSGTDKTKGGLLSSFVRSMSVNVMGTGALTRDDIAPALAELKRKLMERNVAEEIAEKLTESVAVSLEGQKLSSFTRVSSAVRTAVEQALTRILTPKRSIDVLREVRASKERGKPYVIVFVGVNGVGKSTNLAKVAYWLLQNGQKVMIAACDTFRSGAVEQLKTHCARLNVPLYERGYEKDPAKVAFEGAKAAQRAGVDVLLVDTAGRMQDNEPLMRALSNLINLNQPDLVLFVGEALVGNDAVDQLTKFNKRLADLAPGPSTHLIDGIVLTKFDTIDDKVGAALSMVYTSGAPIMFVGCGQTYVDLKRLNAKSVVQSLLK
ncbi:putative Signal recognition particle receptor subunit alpha [Nannochloris sp. 'desiccata']|nr:putative Signal recognition particle receptor subunit alpha [Chlorella desiccata (nom. nud.)]